MMTSRVLDSKLSAKCEIFIWIIYEIHLIAFLQTLIGCSAMRPRRHRQETQHRLRLGETIAYGRYTYLR
jgi:hypothetical protein